MNIRELFARLPKTDLHVHLDGSLRISTIFELAEKDKVILPAANEEELKKLICCDYQFDSLVHYLRGFDVTLSVLQSEQALRRVAYELAEDAAGENIHYMEVRYSPILHTRKGLSLSAISQAVISGLIEAEEKFKIKTGVIICGIRHLDPQHSVELAELSLAGKNKGIVGFDLAGAEAEFPAEDHRLAFDLAKRNNLNITIHAGEAAGAESIFQAIHTCGAHRIGHGTRLYEDKDLLNYVNDHRIPLEICLSSNLQTKAVNSLQEHPFKDYFDKGLRVTLNTDNRLISQTTLTDEYMIAVDELGLDYHQIKKIIINGFKSAFLPYLEKKELINRVYSEIAALEKSAK